MSVCTSNSSSFPSDRQRYLGRLASIVLLMQDPNPSSKTRKPWYKKALEMATLWKTISKTPSPNASTTIWKNINTTNSNINKQKVKRCASLRLATSFTRVCLCAPISSYTEVFTTDAPPRRSYSYPRTSTSRPVSGPQALQDRALSARLSVEGRRVFRGKSLTDDVLMRRFVVEEEAMMQVRRRNQMEIVRKRAALRRKKVGPSPLSRMAIAEDVAFS